MDPGQGKLVSELGRTHRTHNKHRQWLLCLDGTMSAFLFFKYVFVDFREREEGSGIEPETQACALTFGP